MNIEQLKREVKKLQKENTEKTQLLNTANEELQGLKGVIESFEERIESLQSRNGELKMQVISLTPPNDVLKVSGFILDIVKKVPLPFQQIILKQVNANFIAEMQHRMRLLSNELGLVQKTSELNAFELEKFSKGEVFMQ